MTRAWVSGASGFVGHHCLSYWLAHTDWEFTATASFRHHGKTDRLAAAMDRPGFRERVEVHIHDLQAPVSEQAARGMGQVDYMVAMASESHVDRSLDSPVPFVMNNVAVALSTLELARRLKPKALVLFSTDEVYGPVRGIATRDEWSPLLPSSPYCLLPGTDVLTRRGLVPIEEFDPVLHRTVSRDRTTSNTPEGIARRTWTYATDKPVLRIRTREGAEEIGCTPEHRFFIRVSSHASGGAKVEERRAKDVRSGDRICIIRKVPFPPDLKPVQPEYARFLGYWIADGSFSSRNQSVRLADQKREYIDFYRSQAEAAFGVSAKSYTGAFGTVYRHGSKDCWYLQFASKAQRAAVDLSDRLNVIEQALNMPEPALGEFLAGWLDGDGSIIRDGTTVRFVEITCHDARLRRQLKFLLRRLGIVALDKEYSQRVRITDSRSLQLMRIHLPALKWQDADDFRTPQRKPGRAENWMWARVESVTEEPYDGKVYDLEVPAYHNYTANYFLTHNSASKAAQENIAVAYWRAYGVPVIIVNAMNILGERQAAEKYLPRLIRQVSRGETVQVHTGPGGIGSRSYLLAVTVADALQFLLENTEPAFYPEEDRPSRYNLPGQERITNLKLAELVAGTLRRPLHYDLADSGRPGYDEHYGLGRDRLAGLGWKPREDLREGIERIVRWTAAHPEWMDE